MSLNHENPMSGLATNEPATQIPLPVLTLQDKIQAGIAAGIYPPSDLTGMTAIRPIALTHPMFQFEARPSGRFLTVKRIASFMGAAGALTEGTHLLMRGLSLGNTLEEKLAGALLCIGSFLGGYAALHARPSPA